MNFLFPWWDMGSFPGTFLRQAKKFRIEYFDLVLHQDVGWFDLKAATSRAGRWRRFFCFGQKRHTTKMME